MTEETNSTMSIKPHHKKLGLVILALVVIIGLACMMSKNSMYRNAPNKDAYQAVFLSNGQVYFGKLNTRGHAVSLTDIFYLQVTQQLQPAGEDDEAPATNAQPNIQLVKLGSELHGPEDAMHIERDKILFWENMKADSKVVQAIAQYKEKQ